MARSNAGSVVRFLSLGTLMIAGGAAIGYYVFGGSHSSPPVEAPGIQESTVPSETAPARVVKPRRAARTRLSSDYTAPGAPRIHIIEDPTSTPDDRSDRPGDAHRSSDRADQADIPTPDVEASQQGDTPPSSDSTPSPGGADSAASPAPPRKTLMGDPEASQTGTTNPTPAGAPTASKPHEHSREPGPSDPEASQTGDTANSGKSAGAVQYRVQSGSFANAGNASDYVSTLHDHGYDANVRTERRGDKTVYKVQMGAFRNRTDADQAAAGLRRSGVPVTVSPVSP